MDRTASEEEILIRLRQEIDGLDRVILDALEARDKLVRDVGAVKSSRRVFRAGREADLIRRLVKASDLDPYTIEVIWRQIIAASLNRQAPLVIAAMALPQQLEIARFRFGAARYTALDTPAGVLETVASGAADLGVLPHWTSGIWWQDLAAMRAAGRDIFISAITPLAEHEGLDQGVVIAPYLPDASTGDVTVVAQDGRVLEKPGYHPDAPGLLGIFQHR